MISLYDYAELNIPYIIPCVQSQKQALIKQCREKTNGEILNYSEHCEKILHNFLDCSKSYSNNKICMNQYDIRLKASDCGSFSWPPGVQSMVDLMNVLFFIC